MLAVPVAPPSDLAFLTLRLRLSARVGFTLYHGAWVPRLDASAGGLRYRSEGSGFSGKSIPSISEGFFVEGRWVSLR